MKKPKTKKTRKPKPEPALEARDALDAAPPPAAEPALLPNDDDAKGIAIAARVQEAMRRKYEAQLAGAAAHNRSLLASIDALSLGNEQIVAGYEEQIAKAREVDREDRARFVAKLWNVMRAVMRAKDLPEAHESVQGFAKVARAEGWGP